MNKSELFKAAHKLVKSVIQSGDNYQITFGAALKTVIAQSKTQDFSIYTNIWVNPKNNETRLYLNKWIGSGKDAYQSNENFGYIVIDRTPKSDNGLSFDNPARILSHKIRGLDIEKTIEAVIARSTKNRIPLASNCTLKI